MALGLGMGLAQDVPATKQGLDNAAATAASASKGKTGEMPLDTPIPDRDSDTSATASPVAAGARGSSIRVGTAIEMKMGEAVSSGVQINGARVHGVLTAGVRTTAGVVLPVGTAVDATVVSSAKAGVIASGGVLSIQVMRVGGVPVITDVVDFNGKEGHKDVADAAPAKGSEAMVPVGAALTFHVMQQGKATGLVPGVAPAKGAGGEQGGGGQPAVNGSPIAGQHAVGGATQGVVPQGSPK